jgi:trk system potassium uptake protein TrkA
VRAVFVGAGTLTIMTIRTLLRRGHDVVIVERDRDKIETLAEELDCGFLHGDGTKPAVLRESDPEGTDFLFCLTGDDQTNIIAGLVGRSLGFRRVVTKVEDEDLEHICLELGLTETIIPDNFIARRLADIVDGQDIRELELMIKGDARVFSFVAATADECPLEDLDLPPRTRVVCLYRNGEFLVPGDATRIRENDEIVIVSHRDQLHLLAERWNGANHDAAD